jgi:hypothetical protein
MAVLKHIFPRVDVFFWQLYVAVSYHVLCPVPSLPRYVIVPNIARYVQLGSSGLARGECWSRVTKDWVLLWITLSLRIALSCDVEPARTFLAPPLSLNWLVFRSAVTVLNLRVSWLAGLDHELLLARVWLIEVFEGGRIGVCISVGAVSARWFHDLYLVVFTSILISFKFILSLFPLTIF